MTNMKSMNQVFSESRFSLVLLLALVLILIACFKLPDQLTLRALVPLSGNQYTNGTENGRLVESVKETKRSEDRQQTISQEVNEILDEYNSSKKDHNDVDHINSTVNIHATEIQQGKPQTQEELQKDQPKFHTLTKYKTNMNDVPDVLHVEGSTKVIKQQTPAKPICDNTNWRYQACDITGDARTFGIFSTVLYVPPPSNLNLAAKNWTISAQSRRAVKAKNVTVKSLFSSLEAPRCSIQNNVPAIVFALGGLTGNLWHDFSDILVPLFINSCEFNGEVQFLITDMHTWFMQKYHLVFKKLSRYEIINFDKDSEVRCYPRVMVGLKSHKDLGIDPERTPNGYNLFDFRMFIRDAFDLPRAMDIPYKLNTDPDKKPRVLLVLRSRNRRFMNGQEIVEMVQKSGFEVLAVEPTRDLNISEFARKVDSCDILMGAHGAALTNMMFLRTNALMLQIIPYGKMEHDSYIFFIRPAVDMKLRHLEYSISAEETTLLEKYGWDHLAIRDPDSIHRQGWQMGMKYYWLEQDIRLNLTRFAPVLVEAQQVISQ